MAAPETPAAAAVASGNLATGGDSFLEFLASFPRHGNPGWADGGISIGGGPTFLLRSDQPEALLGLSSSAGHAPPTPARMPLSNLASI